MTAAKVLYPTARRIYHPELTHCPYCGTTMILLNYLVSDKSIQTLTGPLAMASRPSQCPDPACPGFALRLRSITAQHLTLSGCTYGRAPCIMEPICPCWPPAPASTTRPSHGWPNRPGDCC